MFCYSVYQNLYYRIQHIANSAFTILGKTISGRNTNFLYNMVIVSNDTYHFLSTYHALGIGSSMKCIILLILEKSLRVSTTIIPVLHVKGQSQVMFLAFLIRELLNHSPIRIRMTIQQCLQYYILLQILIWFLLSLTLEGRVFQETTQHVILQQPECKGRYQNSFIFN